MTGTELIIASAWRGTLALACGSAAALVLRHASAAVRHAVWTATLAALLALPAALRLAPQWPVAIAAPAAPVPVESVAAAVTVVAEPGQPREPLSWPQDAWLLGAMAAASWFLVGAVRVWRIARHCTPAPYAAEPRTRVLEGAAVPVPMAWGVWRPAVLLPLAARDWPSERLRSALLHEQTHIRRGDLLVQLLSQAVSSLYWFHPLVWLAARQLRKERERACDDAVLRTGIAAPEYAGHLMDLARALAGQRIQAPAMAESSDLEGRVRALLDRRRNRRPLGQKAAAGIACGFLAVLLPVALLRAEARRPALPAAAPLVAAPSIAPPAAAEPPVAPRPARRLRTRPLLAQAAPPQSPLPPRDMFVITDAPEVNGPISGIVFDPSGARVPGCQVMARSLDTQGIWTTRTDATGAYKFDSMSGRFLLQFDVPGFKSSLVMAQKGPQTIWLTLGSVFLHSAVGAPKPAVVGVAPPPAPQRLRVGGNVQPTKLIFKSEPVYPPDLQQLGVEGTVAIRAVISPTGQPTNLQAINTDIDPRLAQAALDAVAQWRFQPTLLNGEPVVTETTITVDFKLEP